MKNKLAKKAAKKGIKLIKKAGKRKIKMIQAKKSPWDSEMDFGDGSLKNQQV